MQDGASLKAGAGGCGLDRLEVRGSGCLAEGLLGLGAGCCVVVAAGGCCDVVLAFTCTVGVLVRVSNKRLVTREAGGWAAQPGWLALTPAAGPLAAGQTS